MAVRLPDQQNRGAKPEPSDRQSKGLESQPVVVGLGMGTATMTSGIKDMPTTSAPSARKRRYSARVSRFGPTTAT